MTTPNEQQPEPEPEDPQLFADRIAAAECGASQRPRHRLPRLDQDHLDAQAWAARLLAVEAGQACRERCR